MRSRWKQGVVWTVAVDEVKMEAGGGVAVDEKRA
jgi:hypothetical protein